MSTPTMDNDGVWASCVKKAVELGILHATLGEKPRTEKALMQAFSGIALRHGHSKYLRTAYGGAYNGIKVNQRVRAKTQVPESKP